MPGDGITSGSPFVNGVVRTGISCRLELQHAVRNSCAAVMRSGIHWQKTTFCRPNSSVPDAAIKSTTGQTRNQQSRQSDILVFDPTVVSQCIDDHADEQQTGDLWAYVNGFISMNLLPWSHVAPTSPTSLLLNGRTAEHHQDRDPGQYNNPTKPGAMRNSETARPIISTRSNLGWFPTPPPFPQLLDRVNISSIFATAYT